MEALRRISDFLWAVIFNWKGLAAGLLFLTVSLVQLLPEKWRQRIDSRFPPETRRRLLVIALALLFVVASFQAFDDISTKLANEKDKSTVIDTLRDRISALEKQQRDENSLYQEGRVVATAENPSVDALRQLIVFSVITSQKEIDMVKGFEFRDWKLVCSGQPSGSMSFGAFRQISYPNVTCRIIGTR